MIGQVSTVPAQMRFVSTCFMPGIYQTFSNQGHCTGCTAQAVQGLTVFYSTGKSYYYSGY